MAHRDLDAVCALFEVAAKAEEQRGHTSAAVFLDTLTAQLERELPMDIKADSVKVTDAGVETQFSTRNATIPRSEQDSCFSNI